MTKDMGHPQTILLARQPIFNRDNKIVAFELLFRDQNPDAAQIDDPDLASSQVLLNAFTHLRIEDIVGVNRAYINFTRHLIKDPPLFDQKRFVVEVLETEVIDNELTEAVKVLRDRGYTIALDGFVKKPGCEDLLRLVDIVKIDVLMYSPKELAEIVEFLKPYSLTLIAEKVETHEMHKRCMDLGFEMFQGYFLSKPQLVTGAQVPASKMIVMELLAQIQDPAADADDMERIIKRDPVFSYKVLRMVNSAAYITTGSSKIDSISRAVNVLGLDKIRSLASILALSNLQGKPSAVILHTLVRAKMCENLGVHMDAQHASLFFSVGMLSTLDAFFDLELQELLPQLNLSPTVIEAIVDKKGSAGVALSTVMAYERGHWGKVPWRHLRDYSLGPDKFYPAYSEAILWSETAL